jgi:predicted Zn-dependent protease
MLVAAGAVAAAVRQYRLSERADGIRLALGGKLDAAEPLLAAALARDPDDVDALRALALGRMGAGRVKQAEEPLDRWRALRPDDAEAHLQRVAQARATKRLPEAVAAAQEALRLRPRNPELRRQLAMWLLALGRLAEADAECARCRDEAPMDPGPAHLEAEIAFQRGDHYRARRVLDALLKDHPRLDGARVLRAALDVEAGRFEAAIQPLRAAADARGPSQQRARHYLVLALAATGQDAEARAVLARLKEQQAIEQFEKYGRSDAVGYKVGLAEAFLETGREDDAVRLLEAAVAQEPDCSTAHRFLAAHFEARGETERAAEHRRKAAD